MLHVHVGALCVCPFVGGGGGVSISAGQLYCLCVSGALGLCMGGVDSHAGPLCRDNVYLNEKYKLAFSQSTKHRARLLATSMCVKQGPSTTARGPYMT